MKYIGYFFLVLVLCSCYTQMKVKVDIMDLTTLKCTQEYRNKIMAEFDEDHYFQRLETFMKTSVKDVWISAAQKNGFIANKATVEGIINNSTNYIIDSLKKSFQMIKDGDKCNLEFAIGNLKNKMPRYLLQLVVEDFSSDLKPIIPSITPDFNDSTLRTTIVVGVQNINTHSQFGEAITEDDMASLVVQAPERYWTKYDKSVDITNVNPNSKRISPARASRINDTKVQTFMGNADIAIKMDVPAFFVVKGVRLDADQAFKISAKVLNQGIKYLAYASGVPVSSPAGSAESANKFVKIPEINEYDSLQLKVQNVTASNTMAAQTLLQILFAESQKLNRQLTNDELKTSVGTIQQAFTIYKSQLNQNK
jgi:hypothetical protein